MGTRSKILLKTTTDLMYHVTCCLVSEDSSNAHFCFLVHLISLLHHGRSLKSCMWQLFQQYVPFQDLKCTLVCCTDEPHCLNMSDYRRTYALFPARLHLPPSIHSLQFSWRQNNTHNRGVWPLWSESVWLLLVWHTKDKVCSSNSHIKDYQKENIHIVVFHFLEISFTMNC
jgi:hypothetical protein